MTSSTTASEEPILLRDDDNGVTTLTLNRADARNALSTTLMTVLQDEIESIATDKKVKVVVIDANGPVFCSGHDLKELRAHPSRDFYERLFRQCSELMLGITRLPVPVIAKIKGMATAAGLQLVATCDLAIASNETHFATPGVNIGLFCSTPMVALTRAIGQKKAMEMLLLGDTVSAADAEKAGLINRAVAPGELDAVVGDIAHRIATKSALTLSIGKEAFYRQADLDLPAAYHYASEIMTRNMMARDAEEGIDAFLAKRNPVWHGC